MLVEPQGKWRIFTQREFGQTLRNWNPTGSVSIGLWDDEGKLPSQEQRSNHIHCFDKAFDGTVRRLQKHLQTISFEHGHEGKVPRANTYRPYRLTVDGNVQAVLVLRHSEAFNLCEIDVFLTTESLGLDLLESTRAALLFAFSDATKNAGSMAVQFTGKCAPKGIFPHVRILANRVGVELKHADSGSLAPDEVRELYLRLCGLSPEAQERIHDFAQRRFFSIERVCYLVADGLWPAYETDVLLLCSPYPDLVLGNGIDPSSRNLYAHSMSHAKGAVLSGILHRSLRYVKTDLNQAQFVERNRYLQIPYRFDANQFSISHGPLPEMIRLERWDPITDVSLPFPAGATIVVFPRPRLRDEIRVYLKHDLDQARAVSNDNGKTYVLLVYPDDYRQLSKDERIEADRMAKSYGVKIVASPESAAGLESEVLRRVRAGRTVRQ